MFDKKVIKIDIAYSTEKSENHINSIEFNISILCIKGKLF